MELGLTLICLGGLFLLGLTAEALARRVRLPRVTLLLAAGIAVGPSGFDLLPGAATEWYEFLATLGLTMVAFLLGGSLSGKNLRSQGRLILTVSLAIVATTLTVVAAGLWLAGAGPALAVILAAIATATAPAATRDVIAQSGAEGPFPDALRGVVAVDDAWGLIAFSLALVAAAALGGAGANPAEPAAGGIMTAALWEAGGAVLLGALIGFPAAALTGRIKSGQPLQTEALAIVFLTAGAALLTHVSFLIAGIVAGTIVVNTARHHRSAFHEIEHLQWPFMLLFFILAGATLEVTKLGEVGLLGAGYVVLRVLGRITGGWLGATLGGAPPTQRKWFGPALLPQAGVAVGMALVASEHFPHLRETILTLTIGTTVLFELVGPAMTHLALRKVEAAEQPPAPAAEGY